MAKKYQRTVQASMQIEETAGLEIHDMTRRDQWAGQPRLAGGQAGAELQVVVGDVHGVVAALHHQVPALRRGSQHHHALSRPQHHLAPSALLCKYSSLYII